MKTKAVRLYGKMIYGRSLNCLDEEDEILARIISDSICMSSYKAAIQGRITSVFLMMLMSTRLLSGMSFAALFWKSGQNGDTNSNQDKNFQYNLR